MSVPDGIPLTITNGGYTFPLNAGLVATYGWLDFIGLPSMLNLDYCGQAIGRLIEQYEDKEDLKKYLCILTQPFQELELVFGDLLQFRSIDTAAGVQLDLLGDIVGADRNGLSDAQYRDLIRFQAAINFSSGEAESVITATKELTESTLVKYAELFPARIVLTIDGANINASTIRLLEQSAPAGVALELTSVMGSTLPFAVAPEAGESDPDAAGFSEPNYAPDANSGGSLTEKFI